MNEYAAEWVNIYMYIINTCIVMQTITVQLHVTRSTTRTNNENKG